MKFKLNPFKSVELFHSSMTRDESRQHAINGYEEFFKTKFSSVATDNFKDMDLHIYYSPDLIIKGIELFHPNQLTYKEIELLGAPKDKIENDLKLHAINYSVEHEDIEIPDIGLSLSCSENQIVSAYISLI